MVQGIGNFPVCQITGKESRDRTDRGKSSWERLHHPALPVSGEKAGSDEQTESMADCHNHNNDEGHGLYLTRYPVNQDLRRDIR